MRLLLGLLVLILSGCVVAPPMVRSEVVFPPGVIMGMDGYWYNGVWVPGPYYGTYWYHGHSMYGRMENHYGMSYWRLH